MARDSAGILLYRRIQGGFQVFLAHPGGPFWARKDQGAWTIPKGAVEDGEETLAAGIREFGEETGFALAGPFQALGKITQKNGKTVFAWACEGDAEPELIRSNTTTVKWAGKVITVPEIDRCEWFDPMTAATKINPAQVELLVRLADILASN